MIEGKICSKCKIYKELSEYIKCITGKYGVKARCRSCDKEYFEEYRSKNKIKLKEYDKNYYKNNLEKSKEYYKMNKEKFREYQRGEKRKEYQDRYNSQNYDGYKQYMKEYRNDNSEKLRIARLEYYYKNKEKIKEKIKRWQKTKEGKEMTKIANHKRRAAKVNNGGSYTTEQWEECLGYFNNECAYTGRVLDNEILHVEHIKAISKGGTSYIWNLCPSIASANHSKYNSELEEWYKQQEYYSEERLNKIYKWQEYSYNKYKEK